MGIQMSERLPAGANKRIDGKQLGDSLLHMAETGATPEGGVNDLEDVEAPA